MLLLGVLGNGVISFKIFLNDVFDKVVRWEPLSLSVVFDIYAAQIDSVSCSSKAIIILRVTSD